MRFPENSTVVVAHGAGWMDRVGRKSFSLSANQDGRPLPRLSHISAASTFLTNLPSISGGNPKRAHRAHDGNSTISADQSIGSLFSDIDVFVFRAQVSGCCPTAISGRFGGTLRRRNFPAGHPSTRTGSIGPMRRQSFSKPRHSL
jgi:hypothetical protein